MTATACSWIRPFAAWQATTEERLRSGEESTEAITSRAARRLAEILADEGAEDLGPTRVFRSDTHDLWSPRPSLVFLVETRAIVLRHPNPFPPFEPFPRLTAAANRARRTVSRVVHNVVAHPLLVLCPPVGEWLHRHSDPGDER